MLESVGLSGFYAIICIFTLAIASLFGLVMFVNKEENFEDVIAAQKKEQEALLNSLQGPSKSVKSNKKWSKLKGKKEKLKKEHEELDSGVDDEEPSTESVLCATYPEIDKNTSAKSSTTDIKTINDLDISVDSEEKVKEIKKAKSHIKHKNVVEEVLTANEVKLESSATEEPCEHDSQRHLSQPETPLLIVGTPNIECAQKKKSSKKVKSGEEHLTLEKLMKEIQYSQLNTSELQQIIDLLLVKQNESDQWVKPNQKCDSSEQMKKQLFEMDSQLLELRKNLQSQTHKNKELRLELQQERNKKDAIQAQLSDRLAQQAKEYELLSKRRDEQHLLEMQGVQTQIQRMQQLIDSSSSHIELQHLKEENTHLKNASLRASQLAEDKKSLVNELHHLQQVNKQLRQDDENLRLQYQQMEQQVHIAQRAKSDTEVTLAQRLQEVNEQLVKANAQNQGILQELKHLQADKEKAEVEIKKLQQLVADDIHKQSSSQLTELMNKQKLTEEFLQKKQVDLENKNKELQAILVELKQTNANLSERDALVNQLTTGNAELKAKIEQKISDSDQVLHKIKSIEISFQEKEGQLQETIENLKKKNNELREKNWKAVDALSKSEDESLKKLKSIELILIKGLSQIHPGVKIPAYNLESLDLFFELYKQNVEVMMIGEIEKNRHVVMKEIEESKLSINSEELQKSQKENAHLKNVLADTESMLSRLQAGVDAEVCKWQKLVEDKDQELEGVIKKLSDLDEALKENKSGKQDLAQMETQLKLIHQQLEINKNENRDLKETVADVENQLTVTQQKLQQEMTDNIKLKESVTNAEEKNLSSASEVNDLNIKLKKAISERDLLIREYKVLKESSSKSQEEIAKFKLEHEKEKQRQLDDYTKEIKKVNDQLSALQNASKSSGKSDKDKDKLIAKLYLEIEELKNDLQEERDRVIVDIETADAEELHKQVDALTEEKHNLSLKLNDLEKSFQEEQSDKDKVLDLQSRLKAAEARVKELEAAESDKIFNQITEAMQ